jgi:putative membrane protein
MMGWYGGGMGWGGWLAMGLFWLLLLAVIVFAVVRLLPGAAQHGPGDDPANRESPEEILDRRFARGEIDLDTYQQQRAALAQHRGPR